MTAFARRSLENLAALELRRRGYELYCWKNTKGEEVDFVVVENETVKQLIQVSYDITLPGTRERETRALKKGLKHFELKRGIILTHNQEETLIEEGFEINVVPFREWLLEETAI